MYNLRTATTRVLKPLLHKFSHSPKVCRCLLKLKKTKNPIRKDCFQVKSNLLTDFRFTTHMNIMILN